MTITLAVDSVVLDLPADLLWSDEFEWAPVEQSVDRSITGAVIVQVAAVVAGRPITLAPEDDESAWCSRAALDVLQGWAAEPGLELTLNLRGVEHQVLFRHHAGPALEARPVVHFSDVQAGDWYRVTLRFMEV